MSVAHAAVTLQDDVLRLDGAIHGTERLLVPRTVQEDFNRHRIASPRSSVCFSCSTRAAKGAVNARRLCSAAVLRTGDR